MSVCAGVQASFPPKPHPTTPPWQDEEPPTHQNSTTPVLVRQYLEMDSKYLVTGHYPLQQITLVGDKRGINVNSPLPSSQAAQLEIHIGHVSVE